MFNKWVFLIDTVDNALSDLEQVGMLRLILFIYRNPGCSRDEAVKGTDISSTTGRARLDQLRYMDWVNQVDSGERNVKSIILTPAGEKVAALIGELEKML